MGERMKKVRNKENLMMEGDFVRNEEKKKVKGERDEIKKNNDNIKNEGEFGGKR
jgi:hypothetical protein